MVKLTMERYIKIRGYEAGIDDKGVVTFIRLFKNNITIGFYTKDMNDEKTLEQFINDKIDLYESSH